ncbi:SseB family protein [Mycobacterium heidelbergense]|uniref:SseB family protein n=1 Tax=Mycobacterium heidelbergense TaxID=53376 RepID=UPI003CF9407A
MSTETNAGRPRLIDNVTLRGAIARFAAHPNQPGALEVLRLCMYGDVLFDVTGSDAFTNGPFAKGSRLQIRRGTGPDHRSALFVFTRHDEINRLYPPGTQTQSLVTPATGALELARRQGDAWLYVDPAGPTCALASAEIDFALRNPNNGRLKHTLAGLDAGHTDRHTVLELLRQDGPLLLAADDAVPGTVRVHTMAHPDGSSSLLGFTSAPEVVAYHPDAAVAALTTQEVLNMVRAQAHSGIIINPAGPSIRFSATELFS